MCSTVLQGLRACHNDVLSRVLDEEVCDLLHQGFQALLLPLQAEDVQLQIPDHIHQSRHLQVVSRMMLLGTSSLETYTRVLQWLPRCFRPEGIQVNYSALTTSAGIWCRLGV